MRNAKSSPPNDFTDLDQVQQRLTDFERRYNATAQLFRWKFTTTDLDGLLARLDRHALDQQQQPATLASRMINPRRTYEQDHQGP